MIRLNSIIIGLALIQVPFLSAREESVAWGLSDRQGKRESMEDAYVVQPLAFPDGSSACYFGLFDGHGGSRASTIAAQHAATDFLAEYVRVLKSSDNHAHVLKEALKSSYYLVDTRITDQCDDGTTAVSAVLVGDVLYSAWVGDSRLVVLDADGKIKASTVDHKPNSPGELQRIGDGKRITQYYVLVNDSGQFQHGARSYGTPVALGPNQQIYRKGPWRLGPLAVSRSLGDKRVREGEPLVSAEPEIMMVSVAPGDRVILACDGVWDVLDTPEVAAYVTKKMALGDSLLQKKHPHFLAKEAMEEAGSTTKLTLVARALRDKAYKKGSTDNISVMIVEVPGIHEMSSEKPPFSISAWVHTIRAVLQRAISLLY